MILSVLLAKIIGLFAVISSIALLQRKNELKSIMRELLNNSPLLFISNIMGLILGLILILLHSVWELNWAGLITVIGWLLFLKHLILLIFAAKIRPLLQKIIDASWYETASIIWLVIGLYLLYISYL